MPPEIIRLVSRRQGTMSENSAVTATMASMITQRLSSPNVYWRRAHHDWKFWVALFLMLRPWSST